MTSANPIADNIRQVSATHDTIKISDASRRGDIMDGFKALSQNQLVAFCHDAGRTIEQLNDGDYEYVIAMIEQHLERPGDIRCMWIVAQADKDGAFNKMEKAFGAAVEPRGEDGPRLSVSLACFSTWKEAKGFLDAQPVGSQYNRIYPVVVTAGREPRTTIPLDEQ